METNPRVPEEVIYEIPFEPMSKLYRLFRDIVISEKIDGTNAALYIDEITGELRIASRKRFIVPDDDNFGFAKWATDNATALKELLGPGIHRGVWWGAGVQRGYGLKTKRFSLFNSGRWTPENTAHILGLSVVPVLYEGPYSDFQVRQALGKLQLGGSLAVPGYMNPEGVVVFHVPSNSSFKVTLGGDGHKFQAAKAAAEAVSKDSKFLLVEDAIQIVIDLAVGNVLEDREADQDSEVLKPIQEKQRTAVAVIEDFFTNVIFG